MHLYLWHHGRQTWLRCGQSACWCEWWEGSTIFLNKNLVLTQHWADQQLLFSMRCQTFQWAVVALMHHLPFPDKDNVQMSAVSTSPCHYIICNTCQFFWTWSYSLVKVHLLWSHFPRLSFCWLPQQLTNSEKKTHSFRQKKKKRAKLSPRMKPVDWLAPWRSK